MPKTNDATGATYAGFEGVVEHAGGFGSTRPGGLSQIDPSREVDGSVVEGFESDEREIEERDGAVGADFAEIHAVDSDKSADEKQEQQDADAGRDDSQRDTGAGNSDDERRDAQLEAAQTSTKGGDQSSAGTSSSGSSKTRAASASRSSSKTR